MQNEIEVLKTIIESQHQTYIFFITSVIGLLAIFLGATWLQNYRANKNIVTKLKNDLLKEIEENFIKEKVKLNEKITLLKTEITDEIEKKVNEKIIRLSAEQCRTMAIQSRIAQLFWTSIDWWFSSIKEALLSEKDRGRFIRNALESIIDNFNEIEKINLPILDHEKLNYDNWLEILEKVTNILDQEKDIITKKLK